MSFLGNIIWFLFGGLIGAISWFLVGILWCCTIIGIPVGIQCFKIAGLSLWPFGKRVEHSDKVSSLLINILWIFISGIELAIAHVVVGLLFCITIVGIPFGKQHFKLASLALMPFGAEVVKD